MSVRSLSRWTLPSTVASVVNSDPASPARRGGVRGMGGQHEKPNFFFLLREFFLCGMFLLRRVALPQSPLVSPLRERGRLLTRGLAKKAKDKGKGKAKTAAAVDPEPDGDGSASGIDLERLEAQLERSVGILQREFLGLQAGRATPAMLESLQLTLATGGAPLSSVAKVLAPTPRTLQVSVFDAANVAAVVKGIEASELGLAPEVVGKAVKVALPRPTQEAREALRKEVKRAAEEARQALRGTRQKAMKKAKALPSKDEVKRAEKDVERLVERFMAKVETELGKKEEDLMTI